MLNSNQNNKDSIESTDNKLQRNKIIDEVLEELYKGLNNMTIKEYSTKGFLFNSLIRKGCSNAIICVQDMKD